MTQKLIVATNSPRRQELMKNTGFRFEIFSRNIDESISADTPTDQIAKRISEKKNAAYRELLGDEIILTADTIVINENKVLGKPKSPEDAFQMLESLSGKKHEVVSGVSISSKEKCVVFDDLTEVYFKLLSTDEITHYIKKFNPFDKAGAYGIQEWIGMIGVEKINGSFYNVMGLPIHKAYDILKSEFGIFPA